MLGADVSSNAATFYGTGLKIYPAGQINWPLGPMEVSRRVL
jgi:hypothetical protein